MNSFKDYMYYLLTTPLKRISRDINQFSILFKVLGTHFDNSMEMLFLAREQSMLAKADSTFLSEHGKDRKMQRYQGETFDNYRKRLMMKTAIAEEAGSNKSIILTLMSLGIEEPILTPTYKYDPVRWAEFDVMIDELYMDVMSLNIIRQEVRKIKQASSVPNYGFILHSNSGSLCGAEIRCTHRIFINELDIKSIYLDGSWNLDGSCLLGVSGDPKRNYKHTVTNCISIKNINAATINLTIEKDLWTLDGSYNLNGSKILDAEIIKGDI